MSGEMASCPEVPGLGFRTVRAEREAPEGGIYSPVEPGSHVGSESLAQRVTPEPKVWRDDIEMVIGKLKEAQAVLHVLGMSDYGALINAPITELTRIHAEMTEAFIEPITWTTKAQDTMRHEMTTRKVNAPCTVEPTVEEMGRKASEELGIPTAGDALDELVGRHEKGWETGVFIQLMPDHPRMTLELSQWNIIQAMVEDGVRRGYDLGALDSH